MFTRLDVIECDLNAIDSYDDDNDDADNRKREKKKKKKSNVKLATTLASRSRKSLRCSPSASFSPVNVSRSAIISTVLRFSQDDLTQDDRKASLPGRSSSLSYVRSTETSVHFIKQAIVMSFYLSYLSLCSSVLLRALVARRGTNTKFFYPLRDLLLSSALPYVYIYICT